MDPLKQYLSEMFPQVQGWCSAHLWQSILPLHLFQRELGVTGPVAEIGVYHGKFLIGLIKTKNVATGNFAIDAFDRQEFNLDGAGRGDLAAFRHNLELCRVPAGSVEVMTADSMALDDDAIAEIRAKAGAFSLFSIDGCHLAEHTINDLRLGMRLTAAEGIIFVDDYYNPSWPGVQEGIAKLFLFDQPRFVPLLYTCNKLFLCHISFHARYVKYAEEWLRLKHPSTTIKHVRRFGYDTLTVSPRLDRQDYLAAA